MRPRRRLGLASYARGHAKNLERAASPIEDKILDAALATRE